eukprot:scaffold3243_cov106-Isochrysis_galbana.AAC.4
MIRTYEYETYVPMRRPFKKCAAVSSYQRCESGWPIRSCNGLACDEDRQYDEHEQQVLTLRPHACRYRGCFLSPPSESLGEKGEERAEVDAVGQPPRRELVGDGVRRRPDAVP